MKNKKTRSKRKHSLLLTVGILVVITFLASVIINMITYTIVYSVLLMYQGAELENNVTDYMADEMGEYASLPWLLDYWEENFGEMDIPQEGLESSWNETHSAYLSHRTTKRMSTGEVETLSGEEQKLFAEACYVALASSFDEVMKKFAQTKLDCTMHYGGDEVFVFFQGDAERSMDTPYALGTHQEFDASVQEAAAEIYRTGTYDTQSENMTTPYDAVPDGPEGKNLLYVYSPILIDGNVQCVITGMVVSESVMENIAFGANTIVRVNSWYLFVTFAVFVVLIYFVAIRPLTVMQKNVRNYKDEKDGGQVRKNLTKVAKRRNEIGVLASDVSDMTEEIDRYVEEVKAQTAERERLSAELSLASRIQENALPSIFPAYPERPEFDIYASMDPAKGVGGDFYDFFLVDEDHLALVMADVSGKGVPAALFMMTSKIILANHAMMKKSPAQILEDANNAIFANNQEKMFVTVWIGILELSTGRLVAANAGHEYPALMQPGEEFSLYKDKHGFVLGARKNRKYTDYEIQLAPGSKLFVYTDGVPEATNANEEIFETGRMIDALNGVKDASPEEVLKGVRRAVDDFVGEAEQFDDLTMLCIEYRGTKL